MLISIIGLIVWIGIFLSVSKAKKFQKRRFLERSILTPGRVFGLGIFFTLTIMYAVLMLFMEQNISIFSLYRIMLESMYHSLQAFVAGSDYDILTAAANGVNEIEAFPLFIGATVLFIAAPVLTFSAIVSVAKNMTAILSFQSRRFKNVCVFSELNEKSIELAISIRENDPDMGIVFTDVSKYNGEYNLELKECTRVLNAICFENDVVSASLRVRREKRHFKFFIIGNDESNNIRQALIISDRYKDCKSTEIYVFAGGTESEMLLSDLQRTSPLKIRRVNPVRSFTYDFINTNGTKILNDGRLNSCGEKEIGAVVVGLGEHGFEMTKALLWYCQMDNYFININAFDVDKDAKSKIMVKCPELLLEGFNNQREAESAKYNIEIHSGIDAETKEFYDKIEKIKNITCVFVCTGSDKKNIEYAARIRQELLKRRTNAVIYTVVYDSYKNFMLQNRLNNEKTRCPIEIIGSLEKIYSNESIIHSSLEEEALDKHKVYFSEKDFWASEYNYRSTMASVIYKNAVIGLKLSGADKAIEDRSEEERKKLRIMEHNRWMVYMRTEGYVKGEKDHYQKTHPDMVPFHELSKEEQMKDNF